MVHVVMSVITAGHFYQMWGEDIFCMWGLSHAAFTTLSCLSNLGRGYLCTDGSVGVFRLQV